MVEARRSEAVVKVVVGGLMVLGLMACAGGSADGTAGDDARAGSAAFAAGGGANSGANGGSVGASSPSPVDAAHPAGGTAASGAPAAGRQRIVFVGTSLTAAFGLDPSLGYPARIQAKLDSAGLAYDVVNLGVSGETSTAARQRLGWILRQPAAVLVLETGANDGLRGMPVDSLRANLLAMIAQAKAATPAPKILLVGMRALPNLGARYAREFEAVYPAVAKATGVALLPFLLDGVAGVERLNQPDGVHPTAEGQRRVADNVWRALRPLLE